MESLKDQFLVSIIVPVYNRKNLINETIDSIIKQTHKNWELIFVDDESTDGTYEVLSEKMQFEPRIRLFKRSRDPKGAQTCRNIGMENANGDYIIFLDSDDLLTPKCLEKRLYFFNNYSGLDFLVFPCSIFKKEPGDTDLLWNISKDKDDFVRFLELDVPWQTSGAFWKKDSLLKNGYWDERLTSWQDMDYHVRAILRGLSYKKINTHPDYYYRLDNVDKISRSDKVIKQLYDRIILAENIYNYLNEAGNMPEIYYRKNYYFFMWICYKFLRKNHFKGVKSALNSLYKFRVISLADKFMITGLMKINSFFIRSSFKKKIGIYLKDFWKRTLYQYFFGQIPPINSTVRIARQDQLLVEENCI